MIEVSTARPQVATQLWVPKEYKQEQVLHMSTKTEKIMVQTNKPAMALVAHLKMNYDQEHKLQRLEGHCWEADSLDTENNWVMDMYLEAETFCWI